MKIALAGPYPQGTLERFQQLLPGHEVVPVLTQEEYDAPSDVQCIIVRVLKTPESVLENKPELKAVIRWGAGYDSVDIQAAGRRGILVMNTPGVNAYAVAELALGMMIMLNRKVLGYWHNARQGNWDRGAFAASSLSLNHKTVGIVGGGNIGRRVAALVQALGARVLYYDVFRMPPEREEQLEMTYAPLDELVAQSDLISLHVPLLDSTRHIIGAEQLARMKPTACLINTARGGLVDDAALLQALREGCLAGAGLDCVEEEGSQVTQDLLSAPNVLVTPHIGGSTADLADAMIPAIAEKIQALAEGGRAENVVNREYLPSHS